VILDTQRAWAESFRLRLGHQQPDRNGQLRPARLTDAMRITSAGREIVEAFAVQYGGEVVPWGDQWQAYLPITELPIMLLPGQALSQWWEHWGSSVISRRCDGVTEQVTGRPCVCPSDVAARMASKDACRPTTRLHIVCPEVAVMGVGMMVSHGLIAAQTLPSAVEMAEVALSRGIRLPAVLRVIEHVGADRRYVVPRIDLVGTSLMSLMSLEGPPPQALPVPTVAGSTEVELGPVPPPGPAPSDDQSLALYAAKRELRTMIDSHDSGIRTAIGDGWRWGSLKPDSLNPPKPDELGDIRDYVAETARAVYLRRQKHANAALGSAGITSDDARHEAIREATNGGTESSARLTQAQCNAVVTYTEELTASEREPA